MVKCSIMETSKTLKVFSTFAVIIAILAVIVLLTFSAKADALTGLFLGGVSSSINFFLLGLAVRTMTSGNLFLAVQAFVARLMIYVFAAFICVRLSFASIIMFACSIIGISLAVFIVYGMGGLKENK